MTLQPNQLSKDITGSRKKQFRAHVTNQPKQNTASYWDGGSRNQYFVYNMKTGARKHCPTGSYPTFDAHIVLEPADVLVKVGTFLGKPATPSFTFLEADRALFVQLFGEPAGTNY